MFHFLLFATLAFFLALLLKMYFKNLCAICFAVSVIWMVGLLLYFLYPNIVFIDPIILSFLMGGSAVGGMYYLGSILPEKYYVFKLPFLLTAFAFIYSIINTKLDIVTVFLILTLWIVFLTFFLFKNNSTKNIFKRIIECCKNW